jgi:predicted CXXCH cytochrome family protein
MVWLCLSLVASAADRLATNPVAGSRGWLTNQLPQARPEAGYLGSSACQQCHHDEHASWHRSYHRTMTQPATSEAVLGPFDGSTVTCSGLAYRVFREGDQYFAEMPDPDVLMYVVQGGRKLALDKIPRVKRPVVMTTGSHNYQTYWVTSPRYPGLLQTLPLVFLPETRQWIPRDAAFLRAPDDKDRMVTQWNHHCIRCHSTGGNPGLDEQGKLQTKVGELGIACEACHGPGKAHVDHQQAAGIGARTKGERTADPTIVNPARLDPVRSAQVCGQCHGNYITREEFALEFARNGPLYQPGDDLHRTRYYIQYPGTNATPAQRTEFAQNKEFYTTRWWEDGTVLAGGREFTALLATPCHTRGTMTCLSCHSMHDSDPNDQLKRGRDGPAACTQCHKEERFTTRLPEHTHHAAGSSGSNCLNCHMPHTTYALFKGIRSHQINSPRAESSARHGVPNACNLCHLDRTLDWTQRQLTTWYRQPPTTLTAEQESVPASLLWLLKGHAAQRIITAWHFGWAPAQQASGTNWPAPFLAQLLNDDYGPVRFVGARSLRSLPGFADFRTDFLAPAPQRDADRTRAARHWESLSLPVPAGLALFDPAGKPLTAAVERLVAERDRRPISIQE